MNCVSRSMLLWSALLLWMCDFSLGALKAPGEFTPDFASGSVNPLQPLHSQETDPEYRRRLSQSSGSEDEDDITCDLTSAQRRQFYNASSRQWIVSDEVLEELNNDLQSIVACTTVDDFILFSTERRIKPSRSTIIPRRLTLSAQPQGSLFRNGVIAETHRKVRLTCPDRGDLITVRNESITIANMIFTGCNRTGHVVVLDSRCNDQSARGVIQFVHTEFRNNVVSENQRLLETVDPSCADVVLENVVIRRSQCEFGCMSLSLNNTLKSIQLRRNQIVDNDNSVVHHSIFMMPVDSETVATDISASRNQIRLFSILESRFTLRESNFNSNTIVPVNQPVFESVGGSVLLSNSSTVDISDSAFVNNTGLNGGAVYTINGTSFTISRCTFSNNNATLGAGVFSNQSMSVRVMNSRFLDNNGSSGAGLYIVDGEMTVESSEFRRNHAAFGGGGLATFHVDTSILDSTFLNNSGAYGGACMFLDESSVRVTKVKFAHNRIIEEGVAGAIYSNHTTLDFRNVSFYRNVADYLQMILFIGNGSATFVDCNITNNRAYEGAIFIRNSSALFERVSFQRNSGGTGGGIRVFGSNITVTRSVFLRNSVISWGGGIYAAEDTRLEVSDSRFHRNAARAIMYNRCGGGAIFSARSTVLIRDTNFTNNLAGDEGGGCSFYNANATLRNLIFRRNRAYYGNGGGMHIGESHVFGQELLFEYNHADYSGGGCFAHSHSLFTLSQSQFVNNTAIYGGGISAYEATLDLTSSCIFRGNDKSALSTRFYSNASITSCVFDSNTAERGGSFETEEYTHSRVVNCTFISSTSNLEGGCIRMYNDTRMSITNSSFTRCQSGSEGGGIYVGIESNLMMKSCRLWRNRATKGAGVYVTDGSLNVDESDFNLCQSSDSGGGICSTNRSVVTIQNSSFRRNVVEDGSGGGVYGDNSTSINLVETEFAHNSANHGAGLCTSDMESVNCDSINFVENNASQAGGGARVAIANRVQSFHNCRFVRNTAEEGGCLAGLNAELGITNTLCEESTATIRGGGLFVDNCSITMNDTDVFSNEAQNFSGILATNSSQIIARNLSSSMNIASEDGGGIGIVNGSSLLCSRCKFEHNMATRGAGLFIEADNSSPLSIQLQDASVLNNSALTYGGGMFFIRPLDFSVNCSTPGTTCSRVALLNTDFQNNSAGQSGAVILTADPETVLISCTQQRLQNTFLESDQISSLDAIDPRRLCSSWTQNQVAENAPGDTVGTFGQVLSFSTDPHEEMQIIGDVLSGFVLENVASGIPLPEILVTVLDAYGNGPLPDMPNTFAARMVSPDGFFQGSSTANVTNDSGNFSNVVGFKPPGNYTLRIKPNTTDIHIAELVVHVRGCRIGEEPTEDGVLCQKCDAVSFSFDPGRLGGCTPCLSDASCANRFIVPKDGYWHKSPCHDSVKECLTDEACSYKERQHQLGNFTEDFHDCKFNQTTLMEYGNVSCREGYEGPLCGSCAGGYGLSLGFKCSKCDTDFESVITLLLFTLYLLAISSFTIRGGLPFSPRYTDAAAPSTSSPIHEEVGEEQQQKDVEINFQMVKMMRDGYVPPEHFKRLVTQNECTLGQQQSDEHQQVFNELELTRWIMTEIFKVMINFLQVTAVAATINVRWTEGVLDMFEASEYIGALTTAALSRPIDCLASSSSATVRSVWRTLLSLFVPGAVMGIFASFWGIITYRQSRGLSYFWKRITLSIVAVMYISYLGLTKLAVRVFYCVDVYNSDSAETDSQDRVWAVDTSIRCYEKEHFGLIMIAVLVLVLVSFSFPLISAFVLSQNKAKHRDTSSWTMETMGFLYRAFKEQYVFWESLVMLRKACLSIIVVFSYPLGGQAQGVLALIVLVFSHHLHLIYLPYKKEFHRLNYYESGSLLVSSVTFVLSQFFIVERSSDSTRVLVAVFAIMMNTLFFAFLLVVLFRSGIVHLKALLKSEDHAINENACWWVVLTLYVKSRTTKWTLAKN